MKEEAQRAEALPWLVPLLSQYREQALPSGLLLTGELDLGLGALGSWLALQQLGDSASAVADYFEVSVPAKRQTIGVEQIRDTNKFIATTSVNGRGRVVLIREAERMTVSAANALLKTLEEPPPGGLLILIAPSVQSLLPTIVSRVHRHHVLPPSKDVGLAWAQAAMPQASSLPEEKLTLLWTLARGVPARVVELINSDVVARLEKLATQLNSALEPGADLLQVAQSWADDLGVQVLDNAVYLLVEVLRQRQGKGRWSATLPVLESLQEGLRHLSDSQLHEFLDAIQLSIARATGRQSEDAIYASESLRIGGPLNLPWVIADTVVRFKRAQIKSA